MLRTAAPVVNAHRKLAFDATTAPVCVRVEAVTTTVMLPLVPSTLMLASKDVMELVLSIEIVAVGAPVKTQLAHDVEVSFVVVCSVIETLDAAAK